MSWSWPSSSAAKGRNIPAATRRDEYIAGYTILNDFSARDIQRREMKVRLGPAKGQTLVLAGLGPWMVTTDEIRRSLCVGDDGPREWRRVVARKLTVICFWKLEQE